MDRQAYQDSVKLLFKGKIIISQLGRQKRASFYPTQMHYAALFTQPNG